MVELIIKLVMIVLGFWLPAVLLDAIRAETAEKAQSARKKFCVGCGLFCGVIGACDIKENT